jgi:CDP-6-deoxy-D-xylo-4-hexulose-3-dehydrase
MGIPTDIEVWAEAAQERGIPLIEDCCEAHGAKRNGKLLGSWGSMSTFSFFFSHHLTTIEGGMVCTDDSLVADTLRSLRAHGWIRERSDREQMARLHPDIDPRFLFLHHGYNVRPTEVQAAFGIHQLPRLAAEVDRRVRIVEDWRAFITRERLGMDLPVPAKGDVASWFGVPLFLREELKKDRAAVVDALSAAGVETRPIMGGNFAEQPAAKRHGFLQTGTLTQAEFVNRRGLYIGIPATSSESVVKAAQAALKKAVS